MTQHSSDISKVGLLREIISNTSDSIELLREGVSNAIDAQATRVSLALTHLGGQLWTIVFEDDGNGMEDKHVQAFFNAGFTVKDVVPQLPAGVPKLKDSLSIGEKGLGSKTFFRASRIDLESRRKGTNDIRVAQMIEPRKDIAAGRMPTYEFDVNPQPYTPKLTQHGTRIELTGVVIESFLGKHTTDPDEVTKRVLHYLQNFTAAGTVKNLFAHLPHIQGYVLNPGTIPQVTLEVTIPPNASRPTTTTGLFPMPSTCVAPTGGPLDPDGSGVQRNSWLFCDRYDFNRSKTLTIGGVQTTVYYEGTAIIAGKSVRDDLVAGALRSGVGHKSLLGLHLCKDFVPMKLSHELSRELLHDEYYYEFKVFLNSQNFALNADRNIVTNMDSEEVSWIRDDFKSAVWKQVEAKWKIYRAMVDDEDARIESHKRTVSVQNLKAGYAATAPLVTQKSSGLLFVKEPTKEADVSHIFAMALQSGHYNTELDPIARIGRYVDDSTDVLAESGTGATLLVEVEKELPNVFRHKHPLQSYDVVVVWSLGGMSVGDTKQAPWGSGGRNVPVMLQKDAATNHYVLKWGTHSKRVIVLREFV